jgi:hypothetical protein
MCDILMDRLLIILSVIHDPIHRRLIDDNEQRIWCIVNYSTKLNIFNSVINIIHFLLPFIINIISAVLIMMIVARQRSVSNTRQTFREHLQKQFREHKYLIISPCVLPSELYRKEFYKIITQYRNRIRQRLYMSN